MSSILDCKFRRVGTCDFFSVVCTRGEVLSASSERALFFEIVFDQDGSYEVSLVRNQLKAEIERIAAIKGSKSGDFNADRLRDAAIVRTMRKVEHYPMLPEIVFEDGSKKPHPVAELIYSNTVKLTPLKTVSDLPEALENLENKFASDHSKTTLDFRSVSKSDVGSLVYVGDPDGYARLAKILSFGFHKAIPPDRVLREASSLKAAEAFIEPSKPPFPIHPSLEGFVTMARVAVVGVTHPMLDSCDISISGARKLSCKLIREKLDPDPEAEGELYPIVSKSGIDLVRRSIQIFDESIEGAGPMRLVLPGGVKFVGQPRDFHMEDSDGEIDMMIDFETIAKKGAVALFPMSDPSCWDAEMTVDDCIRYFLSLHRKKVKVEKDDGGSETYEGYVLNVPVMRSGQRHTELCKRTTRIPTDMISRAILNQPLMSHKKDEEQYVQLCEFRKAIEKAKSGVR